MWSGEIFGCSPKKRRTDRVLGDELSNWTLENCLKFIHFSSSTLCDAPSSSILPFTPNPPNLNPYNELFIMNIFPAKPSVRLNQSINLNFTSALLSAWRRIHHTISHNPRQSQSNSKFAAAFSLTSIPSFLYLRRRLHVMTVFTYLGRHRCRRWQWRMMRCLCFHVNLASGRFEAFDESRSQNGSAWCRLAAGKFVKFKVNVLENWSLVNVSEVWDVSQIFFSCIFEQCPYFINHFTFRLYTQDDEVHNLSHLHIISSFFRTFDTP